MSRKALLFTLAALACATTLAFAPALRSDPPAPPKQPAPRKDGAKATKTESRWWSSLELLNVEMDMKEFQAPMKLKEVLELASEHGTGGRIPGKVPIILNAAAFKAANADAPEIEQAQVAFPLVPKKFTLAEVLRVALAQVPEKNATFIIRRGRIEITTYADATVQALLSQPLAMPFENRPLEEAMRDLAWQSGATIVLDARAGEKLRTPVSATFLHDASVWSAAYLLSDMAGLKAVVMEDCVYITTPERAEAYRKEQQRKAASPTGPLTPFGPAPEPEPSGPQFRRPQQSYPDVNNAREAAALSPAPRFSASAGA